MHDGLKKFSVHHVKTNGINLRNLAPPQISPLTGKRGANFTLECRYPERTR